MDDGVGEEAGAICIRQFGRLSLSGSRSLGIEN